MRNKSLIGVFLIVSGFVLIAINSAISITGNVVNSGMGSGVSIPGLIFIALGLAIFISNKNLEGFVGEKEIKSSVKKDPRLFKLAKEIQGKQYVQKDINHLIEELRKGNENPGMGSEKLFNDISYLRGTHGGRVFYRPQKEGYEILAYAIGTGQGKGKNKNERRVISHLRDVYQKKKKAS